MRDSSQGGAPQWLHLNSTIHRVFMCGNSDAFPDPHGKKKFVFKRGEIFVYQFRRDRVADDIEKSDVCKTCVENLISKG